MDLTIPQLHARLLTQRFGVLVTADHPCPHCSLMAFVMDAEMRWILVVTSRDSQKYRNLCAHATGSFFLDTRSNAPTDVHEAMTCACAWVWDPASPDTQTVLPGLCDRFRDRHPYLSAFLDAPSTESILLRVTTLQIVRNFEDQQSIQMP